MGRAVARADGTDSACPWVSLTIAAMKSSFDPTLWTFQTETAATGTQHVLAPGERPSPRPPRKPQPPCVYQGEPFAADDGGTATELVPWGGCGSVQGKRPTTVCGCACQDNAAGECLPFYRPCEKDRAAYIGRPWVCDGCPHRE